MLLTKERITHAGHLRECSRCSERARPPCPPSSFVEGEKRRAGEGRARIESRMSHFVSFPLRRWTMLLGLGLLLGLVHGALNPPASNSLHPIQISRIIELGALTRTSTLYTLKRDDSRPLQHSGAAVEREDWIVGIRGQEGFVEAKQGKTGAKEAATVTYLGRRDDECALLSLR